MVWIGKEEKNTRIIMLTVIKFGEKRAYDRARDSAHPVLVEVSRSKLVTLSAPVAVCVV